MTAEEIADRGVVGLDLEAVRSFLLALGLSPRPPLQCVRIGHGRSNLTFLITDAGSTRCVLRRPPLGHLLASAHDVAREHRILAALEPTAVPTPRVMGLSEGEFGDVPVLAMEYVDGLVIDASGSAETLLPSQRRTIGFALIEALARIHAVTCCRLRAMPPMRHVS
jgi:aminoglycoside phosphotransferase (APT) family kinase protein